MVWNHPQYFLSFLMLKIIHTIDILYREFEKLKTICNTSKVDQLIKIDVTSCILTIGNKHIYFYMMIDFKMFV